MPKQKAQVLKGSLQYVLNQGTHEELKIDISYIPDKTYLQVTDLTQIVDKIREKNPDIKDNDLPEAILFSLRKLLMTPDITLKMRGKVDSCVTITTVVESKRKAGKAAQNGDDADDEEEDHEQSGKRKRHKKLKLEASDAANEVLED
jgi:hypothetical protein